MPLLIREALKAQARTFGGFEGFDPVHELDSCRVAGIRLLHRDGADYPQLLASVSDAPAVLYLSGGLNGGPAIAIVGSRQPTAYGRRVARALAAQAARAGLTVVSGLARGVDTEAHEAALDAGGVTWAVLGSGLGRVYPPENRRLAERIVAGGGALLSEAPLLAAPLAANFPRRNRIISGLSWVTVVVEGLVTSGALITARAALAQGREVGAVPGPIDSDLSAGPHKLLQDGAFPVLGFSDILERLPPGQKTVIKQGLDESANSHYKESLGPALCYKERVGAERQKILKSMGSGEVSFEDLIRETGMDVPALLRALAELEIEGLIDSCPGQRYARR